MTKPQTLLTATCRPRVLVFVCCSLLLALFAVGGPATGAPLAFAAGTVTINPGDDIQAAVNNNPNGTTFVIKAGVHRFQTIVPKTNDVFVGETAGNGAHLSILSGAKVLTSFTQQGNLWVASGQTQQGVLTAYATPKCLENPNDRDFWTGHTNPNTDYTGCIYPEDLFIDNVPLWQVTSLGEVAPGKWYFDYGADKIYFADNPAGHSVETSVTQYAFKQGGINVTIRDLIIEKYAVPAQAEAVAAADGWLVEDNEIRFNHGRGVLASTGTRLIDNKINYNGDLGVTGVGDGVLVQGNEIAYNNYAGYSVNWEAGGAKFVTGATNLVFRNNNVHDNNGHGVWGDWIDTGNVFEDNQIRNNGAAGIFYEASFSAIIRNNVIEHNGFTYHEDSIYYGGGIRLMSSADVEIYGNTILNNRHGIIAINVDKGSSPRGLGKFEVRNLNAHNNTILQDQGIASGIRDDTGTGQAYTSGSNNRFDYNTYQLVNPAGNVHEWQNHPVPKSTWQSSGHDLHSSYSNATSGTQTPGPSPTPTPTPTATPSPSPASTAAAPGSATAAPGTPVASATPTPAPTTTPANPTVPPPQGPTATPNLTPAGSDLNCDGDVDVGDSLVILRLVAGIASDCANGGGSQGAAPRGDLNCDGRVDARDILLLMRHLAGISDPLPCVA